MGSAECLKERCSDVAHPDNSGDGTLKARTSFILTKGLALAKTAAKMPQINEIESSGEIQKPAFSSPTVRVSERLAGLRKGSSTQEAPAQKERLCVPSVTLGVTQKERAPHCFQLTLQ